MATNPLILSTINGLEIPDKIKTILLDIITIENALEVKGEQKNPIPSISKVLEKYANDSEIKEFCERYGRA